MKSLKIANAGRVVNGWAEGRSSRLTKTSLGVGFWLSVVCVLIFSMGSAHSQTLTNAWWEGLVLHVQYDVSLQDGLNANGIWSPVDGYLGGGYTGPFGGSSEAQYDWTGTPNFTGNDGTYHLINDWVGDIPNTDFQVTGGIPGGQIGSFTGAPVPEAGLGLALSIAIFSRAFLNCRVSWTVPHQRST